jgi:hypothetical protein
VNRPVSFTPANSNHPNHSVRTRVLHAYLHRRNENARHPDVLAAQRRGHFTPAPPWGES